MTCAGSGRPLTTLRRYSGIWSTVSGVTWASRRTARSAICALLAEFTNHTDYGLYAFDRGVGHDAVAEIEDVARAPPGGTENLFYTLFQNLDWSKESDGVEIALHRVVVSNRTPAFVERLSPVESDDVGPCGGHFRQQAGGFDAEVNHGHAHGLHGAHQALGRFESVVAIVG